MYRYMKLYIPGSLSMAESFWRMAIVGAVAAGLGDMQVAVFTVGYRIAWLSLSFTGAVVGATNVKIGLALGAGNVAAAKRSMRACFIIITVVLILLAAVVEFCPYSIARLFSSSEKVQGIFVESRRSFAAFVVFMVLGNVFDSMVAAMGRVNIVFVAGLISSWAGQVPFALLFTRFWRSDLVGLYAGVNVGSSFLSLILGGFLLFVDWEQLALEARERSETQGLRPESTTASMVSLQPASDGKNGTGEIVADGA